MAAPVFAEAVFFMSYSSRCLPLAPILNVMKTGLIFLLIFQAILLIVVGYLFFTTFADYVDRQSLNLSCSIFLSAIFLSLTLTVIALSKKDR
jgi:hypothetical protein